MFVIKRCCFNPIITKDQIKPSQDDFEVIGVLNPAAIKVGDETFLLLRVAERYINHNKNVEICPVFDETTNKIQKLILNKNDKTYDFSDSRVIYSNGESYLTSISHLRLARSSDGINFEIADSPTIMASNRYESFGVEDPRITYIDGKYYIVYDSASKFGINVSMVSTKDFIKFKSQGIIFCSDNKDVVLFPEKIGGKYYAFHRPSGSVFGKPEMWLAESEDLIHWGNHRHIMELESETWMSGRIGAGAVPFKTEAGWVEIYHGATVDNRYCLGAMLLDLEKPWKIIAKSEIPLIEPDAIYEREGFFGNVVFSCGLVVEDDMVHIYYGAADESVALIDVSMAEIFENLNIKQKSRSFKEKVLSLAN